MPRLVPVWALGVLPWVAWHFARGGRRRGDSRDFVVDSATVVLVGYTLFFPVRISSLELTGYSSLLFASALPDPRRGVELVYALGTAGMLGFMVAWALLRRLARRGVLPGLRIKRGERGIVVLAVATVLIAGIGLTCLLYGAGGPTGMIRKYLAHTKDVAMNPIERLGLGMWTTFLPFVGPLVAMTVCSKRGRQSRGRAVLAWSVLASLALAGALLLGSRRDVVLVGGSFFVTWTWQRGGVRRIQSLLLGAIALVASVWIVEYRTGSWEGWDARLTGEVLAANAGHSVLDAAAVLATEPRRVRSVALSTERLAWPIVTLVPRVLWPGKPQADDIRLDVAIARNFGGSRWAATGFPASLVGEGWVTAGVAGAFLIVVSFGAVCGLLEAWHDRATEAGDEVVYAVLVTGAFFVFKDGDTVLFFAALMKQLLYFVLLGTGLRLIVWVRRSPNHVVE